MKLRKLSFQKHLTLFILYGIFFGALFSGYNGYLGNVRTPEKSTQGSPMTQIFNIAILRADDSECCKEITRGLEEKLAQSKRATYHTDIFVGMNDQTKMALIAEEILMKKKYDLIFTIDAVFTKIMKSVHQKRKSKTPIVFTCVVDPARLEIVETEARPGGLITGITLDNVTKKFPAELLLQLNQTAKRVLIPFNPTSNGGEAQKEADQITALLKAGGVEAVQVPVEKISDIKQRIEGFLPEVDAIITLVDTMVMAAMEGITKLGNQYKTPVLAFGLEALDQGASYAWGAFFPHFGAVGAEPIEQILLDKMYPGDIPVNRIKDWWSVGVNLAALEKQGGTISNTMKICLDKGFITNGHLK